MSKRLHIGRTLSGDPYDIVTGRGFEALKDEMDGASLSGRKLMIVTDSNVEALFLPELKRVLSSASKRVLSYTIPAGEKEKNLDNVRPLLKRLLEENFDRKDILLALGGGVVGDLTGFASAIYRRGIRFIQVPTTLLSQTDSSIGGKTGVDLDAYKNMVGAFHQPSLVYMNMDTLSQLPEREFSSGMAEIIKHALIRDRDYLAWLSDNAEAVKNRDIEALSEMISWSCRIKAAVVEEDPKEEGLRAILNFGHTLGHAIEKYRLFSATHGECVALGALAAARISMKRGHIDEDELQVVRSTFSRFSLPVVMDEEFDTEEIIELTRSDKKMESGHIRFILLKEIGEACIDISVSDEEMREALNYLRT